MATVKKQVKPTSVKKVEKKEETKSKTSVSSSKKVVAVDPKTTPKKSKEKDFYLDQNEMKKAAEAQKKEEAKKAEKEKAKAKAKAPAKTTTTMKVDDKKTVVISMPAKKTSTGKTVYHVSKRDNNGREWKVFIQGSTKVIQLFDTQLEALEYAKKIAKNKDDGSYVLLHGLDGKIRKY